MAKTPAGIEDLDFENMEDAQLQELSRRVKGEQGNRVNRRIDEFRQMAREAGYEVKMTRIGEGETPPRRKSRSGRGQESEDQRREVAPKYQNPDNPKERWSGRGRKPRWVEMAMAHGRKLEDLVIPT